MPLWFELALATCTLHTAEQPGRLDLLTAAPGPDLFASMGHTALVFSGAGLEEPVAFDWGAYDPSEASVLRFLRGQQPFYLRGQPARRLLADLASQERTVTLQQLTWQPDLLASLNARVGERYTYDWRLANCATRARDTFLPDDPTPAATTARFEGARHLWRWPVLGFAWRFTTGDLLDQPLTVFDRAMVPERLMQAVDSPACTVERRHHWAPTHPPARWPWALPGLAGSAWVLANAPGWRGAVVLYGAVLGVLGTSSLLLFAASSLPGIGPTESWLFAGPQSFLFVAAAVRTSWTRFVPVLAGLAILAVLVAPFTDLDNTEMIAAFVPGVLACSLALWRAR